MQIYLPNNVSVIENKTLQFKLSPVTPLQSKPQLLSIVSVHHNKPRRKRHLFNKASKPVTKQCFRYKKTNNSILFKHCLAVAFPNSTNLALLHCFRKTNTTSPKTHLINNANANLVAQQCFSYRKQNSSNQTKHCYTLAKQTPAAQHGFSAMQQTKS